METPIDQRCRYITEWSDRTPAIPRGLGVVLPAERAHPADPRWYKMSRIIAPRIAMVLIVTSRNKMRTSADQDLDCKRVGLFAAQGGRPNLCRRGGSRAVAK
jgi:hypothetical protein